MKASLEEKKQSELAELRDTLARYHNEEISRRETEWGGHLEKLQSQYEHQIEIGQEPAPKGNFNTLFIAISMMAFLVPSMMLQDNVLGGYFNVWL